MKKLTVLTIIIASVFMIAPVFGQVYPDGMVSYWKFDEGSGTIATDSVGTNDGTLVNGPVWTSGQVDGALSFDGVDDYVEVPDDPSLRGMLELTLEAWIYPVTLDPFYQGIVVKRNHYTPNTLQSYILFIQKSGGIVDRSPILQVFNDSGTIGQAICTDNALSPNQWYHLAGIYTGETVKVYFNGTLCREEPFIGGNLNNAPHRLILGAFAYGSGTNAHFNGLIDEVAIYNRALTPEEIQQHYQNGLNGLGYEEYITTVDIDIKPGSYPNAINLGSHGLIPVAVLSSEDFDAATVDPDTVELAGSGVAVRGKSNKFMAHQEDVDGDGLVDLVAQVATANLDPNSLQDGWAVLTGETFDGEAIEGEDEITIVPAE